MSRRTYGHRMITFGYQKTCRGSMCPFRRETKYLPLWEWRSKGDGRSESEFVPPGWSLVKIICSIDHEERSGIHLSTQQGRKQKWCVWSGSRRFIPHEDCQGIDRASSAYIPSVNCGTCSVYQEQISLPFILAQIASIFLYSKNRDRLEQNTK